MIIRLYLLSTCVLFSQGAGAQGGSDVSCPCCTPEYRQFDFWLGDWIAYDLQKEEEIVAGYNTIVLLQDSCVLQENWSSGSGAYSGTSYNWYDRENDRWHQSWIDNQGGSLRLSGKLEAGKMVLYSEPMNGSKGQVMINRITWTPGSDGTVRQHWELSRDRGGSWETLFDGLYRRMKSK